MFAQHKAGEFENSTLYCEPMLQHHPGGSSRSDLFSASQYGGGLGKTPYKTRINYFVLPIFILELIGLACLWALFYYLRFTTVFPYHHRVFTCDDQTLSKPNFTPDDFTIFVSEATLYCVSFIIPPIVILLGETMFWLFSTKPRKIVLVSCIECKVHLFARRLFRFVSTFLFGALVVCIFIDSIKLITGYQRPYFLTICNVTQTCNRLNNHSPYPSPEVLCNNRRENELRYAWLSFPSIYAGLSSFAAIFTSCYLHYMISLRGAPLLRPFLIFGLMGMAMIASFSRIQGYKNHWADVWWSWVIGGLTAIYLCHNVICFQEMYSIRDEIVQDEVKVAPFFSWFRLPRINPHKEPIYGSYDEEEQPQQQNVPMEANIENGSRNRRKKDRTYEVTTTTESYQRTIHHPNGYDPNNSRNDKNVDVNY